MKNDEDLAHTIRAYWAEHGYEIEIAVTEIAHGTGSYRAVRSSLLNGLPRGWRGEHNLTIPQLIRRKISEDDQRRRHAETPITQAPFAVIS